MKKLSEFSNDQVTQAIDAISRHGQIPPLPKTDDESPPVLYVFRHGQSQDNLEYLFSGWRDSPLTPLGESQAEILAERMKDKQIDTAYCSSLQRSRKTLEIVLKYHPDTKILQDDAIIERSYGDLQGTSKVELYLNDAQLEEKYRRAYDFPAKNGESLKMVEARVQPFLETLLREMRDKQINVAISCHSNSMRAIRKIMENLSVEEMCRIEDPLAQDFTSYKIS